MGFYRVNAMQCHILSTTFINIRLKVATFLISQAAYINQVQMGRQGLDALLERGAYF